MTTIVSMLMTEISHTQYGLMSRLQCGQSHLYVLEPPYKPHDIDNGAIKGGRYEVAKAANSEGVYDWMILAVPGRAGIVFTIGRHVGDTHGDLLLGTELGIHDEMWTVIENHQALEIFNNWVMDVHMFVLYIRRLSAPMKSIEVS